MNAMPHKRHPCKDCPFRKDSLKGWLGKERAEEIAESTSFTCHKTEKQLQCAGHMIVSSENSDYVKLAHRLDIPTGLSGHEKVFETKQQFIEHHT